MENSSFSRLIKSEVQSALTNSMVAGNALLLILVALLVGFLYQADTVNHIPTAVLDLDNTSASRAICTQFSGNERFKVSARARNYDELSRLLAGHQVEAALVIPPGFARELKRQAQPEVLFLVDGSNYIMANTAYARGYEILQTMNAGIAVKMLEGKGLLPREARGLVQQVQLRQHLLYNPANSYRTYLAYGILAAGAFSLLMSALAVSMVRRPVAGPKELPARLLVCSAFAAAVVFSVLRLSSALFGLPARGQLWQYALLCLLYGILIAGFSLLLAALAGNEVRVLQLSIFFVTPLFFATGYTWPVQNIPAVLKPLYLLNPLSPFLNGTRAALVMGAGWTTLRKYLGWMLAQACFYLPCSSYLYCSCVKPGNKTSFAGSESII